MSIEEIICIDPGHGGKDHGGGSNDQFKEKEMVLQISKEQKKHFERNGITVVLTRSNDEYLDSYERTLRVKRSQANYCISNHINAFNGKANGAETIHSIATNGKLAEGILKTLVNEGASYRRFFSKSGKSGKDYYFMHRMTGHVKTIIVEYGFADNKEDTDKIINDWKKYAEAVARYYIENVFDKTYIPEKEIASHNVKNLPKVRSFSKYPRLVKITEDVNAYEHPNLSKYSKMLREGTKLKVYGEGENGVWAAGGGLFFSKKYAVEIPQTIRTGGLTSSNVDEMENYFRKNNLEASVQFVGEGKNPHVLAKIKGGDYEKFCKWLDENNWWYKVM
ncbi:N-acetylmuramoyl-L-alanine amidase [Gracilibacillus sp. YIM 98692]|uniref:N-acetylmuramoyl-L-alanine amidase n=1 Tax=Gracilibacillus sp. YIM 98692 TaxID=2663532 RepID=UPI0013D3E584|nr:N-acetylmuramoyl-L-alanine amidase [Gracilibacillus sp. YIM 98692]